MKVVSTAKLRESLRNELCDRFPEVEFLFYKSMTEAEESWSQAEILVTYGEDVTEDILASFIQLKWIMVISAGLEKMPLRKIKEKGIIVTNARGIHKIPMAEYTFSVLLNVAKNTKIWFENQAQNKWDRRVTMEELFGASMTILGPGAIGNEIARLAKAFGMSTIGVNRSGQSVAHIDKIYTIDQLKEASSNSKYVVAILPETPETQGILDAGFFKALRQDAVFVNIGRGKTVNQTALLEALQAGEFDHAVLDVFEEEPLPENHPFWQMDNVTVTPHFSSVTANYQLRSIDIFKENLTRYLNKETDLINRIDLDRGY